MLTSIVILTYNQIEYTKLCIDSIRRFTKFGTYEIIIVDNASTDGTIEWLKQQDDIKTIFNTGNLGFPKGCNQGIGIANGDNILLLNNDTIVTQNWLDNLLTCLYSAEDIGAVGPVTNSAAYYTAIPVQYQSIEEMHEFASQYNRTDPNKWEERLKLIGFCMLIKKEAVNKIGLLDERFTPGNFEDDDYSVRLREVGYKLFICNDTFIHHFGSVSWKENSDAYSGLLSKNEEKFKEKWGTSSQSYAIELEMIQAIDHLKDSKFKLLHIGCGSGGTLLKVKNHFPHAELFGVELNKFEREEAKRLLNIASNIEVGMFNDHKFDVILFSGNKMILNSTILEFVKKYLINEGCFLAKVPNIGHYSTVYSLLKGNYPFQNSNMLSLSQIEALANDSGLNFSITSIKSFNDQNSQKLINQLSETIGESIRPILESTYFLINGKDRENSKLLLYLDFLYKNSNEEYLHNLKQYDEKIIISTIKENYSDPVNFLNKIAIENFASGNHEYVIPYLQAAFGLEKNDINTLYNISYILKCYGQFDLAKTFIKMIKISDPEIDKLKVELELLQN